jgi:hypothetical protein
MMFAQLYDGSVIRLSGYTVSGYRGITHFEEDYRDPRVRNYIPVREIKCIWRAKNY